jgi:hypothetical protein
LSLSPTLFSGSGPVGLQPVPWIEKKPMKGCHSSSDMEVIAAAETWLNGLYIYIYIYIYGLWTVLSFVGSMLNKPRVCFLPGRAKDLSAPIVQQVLLHGGNSYNLQNQIPCLTYGTAVPQTLFFFADPNWLRNTNADPYVLDRLN